MTTDVDTFPTPADQPAIEESRLGHLRQVTLERDVYRDLLIARTWTPATLKRQVDLERERRGRRK